MHRPHAFTRSVKRRLRRFLPLAIVPVVAAVSSCTPREINGWLEWNAKDPAAAQAFAHQPEIQAQFRQRSSAPAASTQTSGFGKWDPIIRCESGGNWSYNGPSGYDGGLQFLPSTWRAYGGGQYAPYAWQATPSQQIAIAERVLADVGWGAWPTCSRRAGYR